MSTTEDQVRALAEHWAQAERRGDVTALGALITDDFTLVGPLGFVLTRQQWLDRYRTGALRTMSLTCDLAGVRDYAGTAVAAGRVSQRATYQGQPADGQFRVTQVAVRRGADWLLAGMHLSPIAGPPEPGS